MKVWSWINSTLRNLLHKQQMESQLDAEVRVYVEMVAQEYIAKGLSPEEAMRRALVEFGGVEQVKESVRESRSGTTLESIWMDVRWAAKSIRRAPGSALAMVLLLALGMGGVTALFGPLYSLVLKPLPFPHPEQLMRVQGGVQVDFYASPTYFKNQSQLDTIFSGVMTYSPDILSQASASAIPSPNLTIVSANFFRTLGVEPRLGRDFPSGNNFTYRQGQYTPPGVIVSDRYWHSTLHAETNLAKCSYPWGDGKVQVIGVMPPDFDYPSGTQVWVLGQVNFGYSNIVVGRLRPGITATSALTAIKSTFSQEAQGKAGVTLQPLHDYLLGDRRPLLWILSVISLLFLALSCAGVANILLARGVRRRPEMALRQVLGARRGRLIRLLLTETLLLAVMAGVAGVAISAGASYGLERLLPEVVEQSAHLSAASLMAALVLTLAVTVVCGVAPAFHATDADLYSSLKAGGSSHGMRRRWHTVSAHELFAGVQLFAAMILLVCTALLMRSLLARMNFPMGFEAKNIEVVQTSVIRIPEEDAQLKSAWKKYPHGITKDEKSASEFVRLVEPINDAESARNQLLYRESMEKLAAIPGVESVSFMRMPPYSLNLANARHRVRFWPSKEEGGSDQWKRFVPQFTQEISVNAFQILGIPLLAGRNFQPEDMPAPGAWKYAFYGEGHRLHTLPPSQVAILNATAAKKLWPNQNPLGRTFTLDGNPCKVIGVVRDIHETRNDLEILPTVYKPFAASHPLDGQLFLFIVKLRPGISKSDFAAQARSALPSGLDPPKIGPLEEGNGNLPLVLVLLGSFTVVGVIVAGLGVFATATMMAASRTREMGIRMALGSSSNRIARMVLWRSLRMAVGALPLGGFGAWVLSKGLMHLLFEVKVNDPLSYAVSGTILLAISLVAGLWPAIHAAALDPSTTLRYDG